MADGLAFSSILGQLAKLVKNLDANDLQAIAEGDTKLMLVPKGSKVVRPLVLADLAADVRHQPTENDVLRMLESDSRLNPTTLKQLASELNVALPAAAKTKPAIMLHIAQETIGHNRRMRGGL